MMGKGNVDPMRPETLRNRQETIEYMKFTKQQIAEQHGETYMDEICANMDKNSGMRALIVMTWKVGLFPFVVARN